MNPKAWVVDFEPTAKAIVICYLRHAQASALCCPEALAERQRTLPRFADSLGERPVSLCKAFHLSDWIDAHPTWKSGSTRKAKANQVIACFNWATREQRIPFNPFAAVRYEEAQPRPPMEDRVLSRVLLFASKPFERAVRFLRLTGCRLSELCRAAWADVDLEMGVLYMKHHKSRFKTRRSKAVVLLPDAVALLRELSREQGDRREGHVFLNSRNMPWTRQALGQTLRRLKARKGIDTHATLHGIRHQFATVAVRQGAPIKFVSLQLGHSSVAVTEKYYLHLGADVEAIREAIKATLPRNDARFLSAEMQT
jgi:integrase